MLVENSHDSHKPVEIRDLSAQSTSGSGEAEGLNRNAEAARGDPSARKGGLRGYSGSESCPAGPMAGGVRSRGVSQGASAPVVSFTTMCSLVNSSAC